MLSIRSLCSLPTMVCNTVSNIVSQVALLPSYTGSLYYCKSGCSAPFQQQSATQWAILQVRSLCSLPTLVVCTVISQVTLLPSYNSKATVSSLCSLPIPIYSNFSQFIWIFTEFIWIFQENVWRKLLGQFWVSSHLPTCNTAYILDKVFIWVSGPSWTLY